MDNMRVTIKKEITTNICGYLWITVVKENGVITDVTIHSWVSHVSLSLDDWHKANSAIVLALDKLGESNE